MTEMSVKQIQGLYSQAAAQNKQPTQQEVLQASITKELLGDVTSGKLGMNFNHKPIKKHKTGTTFDERLKQARNEQKEYQNTLAQTNNEDFVSRGFKNGMDECLMRGITA